MRTALIVLFGLLLLLHPAMFLIVLGAELAAAAGIGVIVIRASRVWCIPGRTT